MTDHITDLLWRRALCGADLETQPGTAWLFEWTPHNVIAICGNEHDERVGQPVCAIVRGVAEILKALSIRKRIVGMLSNPQKGARLFVQSIIRPFRRFNSPAISPIR